MRGPPNAYDPSVRADADPSPADWGGEELLTMASPKISLRGVTKAFGQKQVLRGIDLDVAPAESVVVIGGSGTGKSVLLKCILGLMEPDAGSIKIDGEETTRLSDAARHHVMRKFGMLFQGGALFDSLKVWPNVAFGPIQSDGMAPAKA